MHVGQFLATLGIAGAVAQTGFGRFVGIDQLFGQVLKAGDPQQPEVLQTTRFYQYVRHPMFLSSILLIWLTPTMTVNLATAYLIATLYFFVGTFVEEKKSVQTFGEAYQKYQQQVPRLIPRLGRTERNTRGTARQPEKRSGYWIVDIRDWTSRGTIDTTMGLCYAPAVTGGFHDPRGSGR